jgi:NAD+ synthase (glutamine-hydrolysing)
MKHHGFIRVAAASPRVKVADCRHNARDILAMMTQAEEEEVSVLVFPELALTGYTCADLFHQHTLLRGAVDALAEIVTDTTFSGVAIVGLPLVVDEDVYNCAAVLHRGAILGVVPKSFIPNYKEFYEMRWFSPAARASSRTLNLLGREIPFGTDLIFTATNVDGLAIGVEICEDLWVPIPPSCLQALHGATVLCNPTASNEIIGKYNYRRQLILNQSGRCVAAYIYASCGVTESTTDVVFGGHCLIAENSTTLGETERFQREATLLISDVDLERLRTDRLHLNSFGDANLYDFGKTDFRKIPFELKRPAAITKFTRVVEAHPFVPRGTDQLRERCQEIFHIQVAGLARRLEQIGKPPVAIGVSGGLDSTLALLVACKTFDLLKAPRDRIKAITMPGFGTSNRTLKNAQALMKALHVSASEVDIRQLCLDQMRALNHRPFDMDVTDMSLEDFVKKLKKLAPENCQDLVFENVQARMRTSILMNTAFVIGTGDVSELALGWCTYNGDHMSMYNPNVSIPKTLVRFLVRWIAENEFDGETRRILLDIAGTEISPELLPTLASGEIGQSTEATIGPYELHDFFLFNFLRYGFGPEKILFLAQHANFDRSYSPEEVAKWLKVFLHRFFANQFKRSCLPDGPKVGTISLSPRGDWRMPSDAQVSLWLAEVESEE